MGKYMRKCSSKGIGDVAVMEVTQVVGVRTRARALAMAAAEARGAGPKRRKVEGGEFHISYLQLRSRSLVLRRNRSAAAAATGTTASDSPAESGSSAAAAAAAGNSGADGDGRRNSGGAEWDRVSRCASNASSEVLVAAGEKASSGSGCAAPEVDDGSETTACNYDGDLRRWRERTPSSKLRERESDDLESTAKPAESGRSQRRVSAPAASAGTSLMPSEAEIEEFFAAAEMQEWKRFAEKYNYDVVKDVPLQGRYEWVQIKP